MMQQLKRLKWPLVGLSLLGLALVLTGPQISTASQPRPTALADLPWQWQHPLPQGNNLTGLTCSAATPAPGQKCLAVGDGGAILSYDGANWTTMASPTAQDLRGVACLPATTHCFAAGDQATLLEYTSAAGWTVVPTAGLLNGYIPARLVGISCYSANLCLAVGEYKTVLYYDGSQWQLVEGQVLGPPGVAPRHTVARPDIFSVSCISAVRCFTVGFDKIFQYDYDVNLPTRWAGSPLIDLDEDSLFGLSCPAADQCWAVGYGRMIWHYDGSTWTEFAVSTTNDRLQGLTCRSTTDCQAVGSAGVAYQYDGNTWTLLPATTLPTSEDLNAVWCGAANLCLVVGNNGTLLTGNSPTWTNLTARLTSQRLNGLSCPNPIRCVAVGNAGSLLTYDGYDWTLVPPTDPTINLQGVSCPDLESCWAVGGSGTILHYVNHDWSNVPSPVNSTLNAVSCPTSQKCLAVGQNGVLLALQSGKWAKLASPDAQGHWLYGLACPTPDSCVAVGANQTILQYDGTNWQKVSAGGPDNYAAVSCPSVTRCYAVGGANLFSRYDGVSWQNSRLSDSSFYPLGLACPQLEECSVVGQGRRNSILNYENGSWSGQVAATTNALWAIQCPTGPSCFAVGEGANIVARQSRLLVTVADDTGDPARPGTLSAALQQAATRPGQVINFRLPTASGGRLLAGNAPLVVPPGTILNGGCRPGPALNLGTAVRLSLSGGDLIYGLKIRGSLTAPTGGGNQVWCSMIGPA